MEANEFETSGKYKLYICSVNECAVVLNRELTMQNSNNISILFYSEYE